MNYVFASSHLPEDNRPLEEEEDDDVQPMLRAGGVRALSHLPQRAQGEPAAPRPTVPTYLPAWITEPLHAEHWTAAEAEPESHGDFEPPAAAGSGGVTGLHGVRNPLTLLNSRPLDPRGGMPPEHAAQQPQPLSGDQGRFSGDSRRGSPGTPYTDTPPETSARGAADGQRSDSWGDRPPPTRPDSSTATTGHGFDGRGTPEASDPEQGLGATGPSPQQRLHGSQRDVAALKERVRASIPPAQPPQFQVDEADEHTQFDLTDQDTGRLLQKGVKFGDHARSVINEELENSPTAVAALNRARELSKKNVVIHYTNDEQAVPRIGLDGTIHIYANPKTLKPGTLAHEISHVLQGWHRTMAMRSGKPLTRDDMQAVSAQGKAELEAIARGVTDAKGDANEERENEAMRVGNIAKAEVSAAKVKRRLEALRNSNNKADKDEHDRLIRNPAEIAKMFWNEMRPPDKRIPPKEGTKHQYNVYRMPENTIYGGYDFTHVLKTLGNGVTHEILKGQTPARDEYQPGPNQHLR